MGHQERHTVIFRDGEVGESEEDEVLLAFLKEGSRRGFAIEERRFVPVIDEEEAIHLLECRRRPPNAEPASPVV